MTSKALNRFGVDAFAVFAETLVDPAAFVCRTIEQVFGPQMAEMPQDPWVAYLTGRYTFLAPQPSDTPQPSDRRHDHRQIPVTDGT